MPRTSCRRRSRARSSRRRSGIRRGRSCRGCSGSSRTAPPAGAGADRRAPLPRAPLRAARRCPIRRGRAEAGRAGLQALEGPRRAPARRCTDRCSVALPAAWSQHRGEIRRRAGRRPPATVRSQLLRGLAMQRQGAAGQPRRRPRDAARAGGARSRWRVRAEVGGRQGRRGERSVRTGRDHALLGPVVFLAELLASAGRGVLCRVRAIVDGGWPAPGGRRAARPARRRRRPAPARLDIQSRPVGAPTSSRGGWARRYRGTAAGRVARSASRVRRWRARDTDVRGQRCVRSILHRPQILARPPALVASAAYSAPCSSTGSRPAASR
jgi:hypothetical protein